MGKPRQFQVGFNYLLPGLQSRLGARFERRMVTAADEAGALGQLPSHMPGSLTASVIPILRGRTVYAKTIHFVCDAKGVVSEVRS